MMESTSILSRQGGLPQVSMVGQLVQALQVTAENVAYFDSEKYLKSLIANKDTRKISREMEKPTKYLDLKPFSKEVDETRQYDLIRGLVLFMAVREHPNKGKTAIAGKFYYF